MPPASDSDWDSSSVGSAASIKSKSGPVEYVASKTEALITKHTNRMWNPVRKDYLCCGRAWTDREYATHHARTHFVVSLCLNCQDWDPSDTRIYERHGAKRGGLRVCKSLKMIRVDEGNWGLAKLDHDFPLSSHLKEGGNPGKFVSGKIPSLRQQAVAYLEGKGAMVKPAAKPKSVDVPSTPNANSSTGAKAPIFKIPKVSAKTVTVDLLPASDLESHSAAETKSKKSARLATVDSDQPAGSGKTKKRRVVQRDFLMEKLPGWKVQLQQKAQELRQLQTLVSVAEMELQHGTPGDMTSEEINSLIELVCQAK